jgi:hypothetical protein
LGDVYRKGKDGKVIWTVFIDLLTPVGKGTDSSRPSPLERTTEHSKQFWYHNKMGLLGHREKCTSVDNCHGTQCVIIAPVYFNQNRTPNYLKRLTL